MCATTGRTEKTRVPPGPARRPGGRLVAAEPAAAFEEDGVGVGAGRSGLPDRVDADADVAEEVIAAGGLGGGSPASGGKKESRRG